jgi:hypothetical protein
MSESTKVMMVQRCFKHPSANVVMLRDGSFICILCFRVLKTESINPPQEEKR